MVDYIPVFKEALDRRRIKYSHHKTVLMFMRHYRYRNNPAVELQMKFVFLLFPARMEAVISIPAALTPEQIASARPLIEEANEDLRHGEIEANNASNCVCFSATFDPLVEEEWCEEAREETHNFIVEFTTDLIPRILLDVFANATGLASVPKDVADNNG